MDTVFPALFIVNLFCNVFRWGNTFLFSVFHPAEELENDFANHLFLPLSVHAQDHHNFGITIHHSLQEKNFLNVLAPVPNGAVCGQFGMQFVNRWWCSWFHMNQLLKPWTEVGFLSHSHVIHYKTSPPPPSIHP